MRTTLTLDEDVAASVRRLLQDRRTSLKQLINDALRQGLKQLETKQAPRTPYRTASVDLGRCLLGSLDDVSEALALAEGESFR